MKIKKVKLIESGSAQGIENLYESWVWKKKERAGFDVVAATTTTYKGFDTPVYLMTVLYEIRL